MKHFGKLGAPLYSIHEYPSLADQERRFTDAGWTHAHARSLWDLWSDDEFVGSCLRTSLDGVESFDEWEEFALFASHYFLLHASTRPGTSDPRRTTSKASAAASQSDKFRLVPNCSAPTGQRRFGALVPGNKAVGLHSGMGRQTRLADTDLYTSQESTDRDALIPPPSNVPARLCHTITSFNGTGDCLLVGGRTSPAAALGDTCVRKNNAWHARSSLPTPRFRHCATRVKVDYDSVLIYGGKTSDGTTLDSWLLWSDNGKGWQPLETTTKENTNPPNARFGACLGNTSDISGVLFGGIGADGTILEDFWTWKLQKRADGSLYVEMKDMTEILQRVSPGYELLSRFGATVTPASWGLVVSGGIMPRQVVPFNSEILLLDSTALLRCIENDSTIDSPAFSTVGLSASFDGPRPLLAGHVSCAVSPDQVLLVGGGAVCFSFGTFWTEGTWTLNLAEEPIENNWKLDRKDIQPTAAGQKFSKPAKPQTFESTAKITIPRVKVESPADFQQILADARPVIIEGSDIGPCTELWTKDYLVNSVGSDRKVGSSSH